MNRNKQTIPEVNTIPAGLANLAQAYQERNVAVGKLTLKRGRETYEYPINETSADVHVIQAQFRSIVITVACVSSLNSEIREILQSRTRYAAIAAVDWIPSPTQLTLLKTKVSEAERRVATGEQIGDPNSSDSRKIIGISKQIRGLILNVERAANSNHVVLILGESGTGKTTVASMIHDESRRATKPFVELNCAAVPESLMESELFGYEKGAFTGAAARKHGLFEAAHEGTLFLDEIGELKLELQAKLLTAIEQRTIRRLGGTHQVKCDVRIIAASSRDLQQMVADRTFREDLYYRLAVLEITVPPLREHREDVPLLVRQRLANEHNFLSPVNAADIDDGAMNELMDYDWPGNVRQLHNVIARLCVHADIGRPVTRVDVRRHLARFTKCSNSLSPSKGGSILLPVECRKLLPGESMQQFTARVKRALIKAVREQTGGTTAASIRLRMNRTALSRLKTKLKISTKPEAAVASQ